MKIKFYQTVILIALIMTGCDAQSTIEQDLPPDFSNSSSSTEQEDSVNETYSDNSQDVDDQSDNISETTSETANETANETADETTSENSLGSIGQGTSQNSLASSMPTSQNQVTTNDGDLNITSVLSEVSFNNIKGKIINIETGLDGNVVIFADELYVYSLEENSVKASTSYVQSTNIKILVTNNGYALLSTVGSTTYCNFYDENLKSINTVTVMEQYFSVDFITVSSDGKKIAYTSILDGLYIIDVVTNAREKIIDFSSETVDIVAFDYIKFTTDGEMIVFKGSKLTPVVGANSVPIYGSVNIDSSNLKTYTSNDYTFNDDCVMAGDTLLLVEDARVLTGRMQLFNASTNNTSTINLISTKETNGKAYISNFGNYFATGEINTNSLVVRLYSTNGTLLSTVTMDNAGKEYFYRGSAVAISEEERVAIISLGNWNNDVETKMYAFKF